jgi:N-sulfoglucosamine sulfohydrolase
LPDLPGVRTELASYYNSVRRLDDTFGKVMQALRIAGLEQNTVVIFLSDNGSATPFGKANCYIASTRTPLIIAWPGLVKPGLMDRTHFVSGIDLLPTLFAGLGVPTPAGVSGRSFLPVLRGETQSGRESVFTQIDYMVSGPARPMRCVQDQDYAYIFNPWSDQATAYRNNNEGQIMKAMMEAAPTQASVAARVQLFRYRAVEELYDLKNDPDSLRNMIESPAHAAVVQKYREKLRALMVTHGDPLLATFDARGNPIRMKAAMDECYLTALPPGKPGEVKGVK